MKSTKILNKKHLTDSLKQEFQNKSTLKTKKWFDNYLQGSIKFRGIKRPAISLIVKKWIKQNAIQDHSLKQKLQIAQELLSSSYAEDKFSGTFFIQNELIKNNKYSSQQDSQILLNYFDSFFKKGFFFDWCTTDSFCVCVLNPFIIKNHFDIAQQVADWRKSKNFWQRRASIISFRVASLEKRYHPLIKKIIGDLVNEDMRFIQTGIGWTLSDMSKKYPQEAEQLFRKYIKKLHVEAIDRHTKHLRSHKILKKLKRSL